MLAIKNTDLPAAQLMAMASSIFSLSDSLPPLVQALLNLKRKQKLTDRENKQIYDCLRDNAVFPAITSIKVLMDLTTGLNSCDFGGGRTLHDDGNCYILLDGTIKVYEMVAEEGGEGTEGEFQHGNIHEDDIRVSVMQPSLRGLMKIEKYKVAIGEVINFRQPSNNPLIFQTLSPVRGLMIDREVFEPIVVSLHQAKIKKLHEFFSSIPLLEKHYRSSLQALINEMEEVSFKFGKKVYSEGEPITHIYIVKEGEFILQKSISSDTQMKRGRLTIKKMTEKERAAQIRNVRQHFRDCPYKIIHNKQLLGDSEYLFNEGLHVSSLRCHLEGSILFKADVETFFKKLVVPENPIERVRQLLAQKYSELQTEIQRGVKFNESNSLVLRCLPNLKSRHKTEHNESRQVIQRSQEASTNKNQRLHQSIPDFHSSQTHKQSCAHNFTFFEKFNKTIMGASHRGKSFRRRTESKEKNPMSESWSGQRKLNKQKKTPAVVQEVVQIVQLKKAYHKLRNLNKVRKGAFEFDIDNVPVFIKKKYAHILKNRPLERSTNDKVS